MLEYRAGTLQDAKTFLSLIAEYYAYDGHSFDAERLRPPLETLLSDPRYGQAWLITVGDAIAGYVIATYGFSLESGGRDLLVDELYLRQAYRGQGIGRQLIDFLQAFCRTQGIRVLYLEVEAHNHAARAFYERVGFAAESSTYFTLMLE